MGRGAGSSCLARCALDWPVFALLAVALLATAAAERNGVALRELRTVFLSGTLFYWLLTRMVPWDSRQLWRLLDGLAAGLAVVSAVALWQLATGQGRVDVEGVWRVRAFYGSPNNLALILDRTLPLALAVTVFGGTSLPRRIIYAALAMLMAIACVATFSKGSLLLGLPVGLGATLLLGSWHAHRRRAMWVLGAAIAVASVLLLLLFQTPRFADLWNFDSGTTFIRLKLWQSALRMAADHPLLGVGPDNFLYAYRSYYVLPGGWEELNLSHPHNLFLDLATRLGVLGLCAGIWLARGPTGAVVPNVARDAIARGFGDRHGPAGRAFGGHRTRAHRQFVLSTGLDGAAGHVGCHPGALAVRVHTKGAQMRIVITGGAGFIGSHLSDRLLADGHEVVVLDNLITGSTDNIAHLVGDRRFTFVYHNVSEYIYLAGDVDAVMHLASPASPVDFDRMPIQILKVGSLGTHHALGLALSKGARFLLASTSEVYGDPKVHPQPESYWGNVNPIGIRGVYDEAKRFSEAITMAYHRVHQIDTRIIRIFNTYGPRMRLDDGRVVPNFIGQALRGQPLTVYGSGSQTRSFCYVSDLVEGMVRLLMSDCTEPVNVGNPWR